MPLGTVASIDFMKVDMWNFDAYEKAEMEIFQPQHQKQVDSGKKASWGLLRYILPTGSETHSSHITVNMYKDYSQFVSAFYGGDGPEMTDEQEKAVEEGLATRDLKWVYIATLIRKARK